MGNINLIMPMAGGGTRFKKEGIDIPKPLIKLNGKPFFFWAAQSIVKFAKIDDLIFIVLKEHVEKYKIDREILKYYPNAKLKIIDQVLNGAVLTCLRGIELIDNENPVLFNDCDHSFLCETFYDFILKSKDDVDGAILTFTSNDPRFSYIEINDLGNVTKTMEKKVISNKAICGAYYFKNKNIFKKSAQKYLDDCNYNEYFISGVYNIMIKENMKIKYFLTDLHISFGTPEEYEESKKYNFEEFI